MSTRPAILLTHTPDMRRNYFGAQALDGLQALGEVRLHGGRDALDGLGVVAAAQGCRFIVADRATALPGDVFRGLAELVAVLRVAVDIRNIDVEAASDAGVLVCQASRAWVATVAEMVIGHMIAIARDIARTDAVYKAGVEQTPRVGRQLFGATAGVIGLGPLGRRVADLCRAFGMTVLVNDPYVQADNPEWRQVAFAELLAQSDFVIPLAVATPETENLIDARALALMKPTAYLINLSRGNLVDERALDAALSARKIAGATLDVGRAADQMPSPELARRHDVVATPHIGGLTPQAIEGQALEVVAQLGELIRGNIPQGTVNGSKAKRLQRSIA
jgi:D-3-phosphoglycerate dehydrogenase / 2-oxoglutarate reductase